MPLIFSAHPSPHTSVAKRLCLGLLVLLLASPAQGSRVVLVLSAPTPSFQAYVREFRSSVERRGAAVEILVTDLADLVSHPLPESNLFVAVGSQAADTLVTRDLQAPLLLTMLPRANYERLSGIPAKTSAVFIDQPSSRYVALVRAALPDFDRISLLAGQDSKTTVSHLMTAARSLRLHPQSETINSPSEIYPAMQRVLANGGVLLATPDASIFNAQTIPNILLSTYRWRVPVVGFSPAYVKAGAVAALYSTPEQIATQSAEASLQILNGGPPPGPQAPNRYTIGINTRVARALGLTLDGDTVIRERLERLEHPQ